MPCSHAVIETTPYCRVLPRSTFGRQSYEDLEYMEYYVRKVQDQFSLLKSGGSDMSELCKRRPRVFCTLTPRPSAKLDLSESY